jgi:hypothetical protein
MRELLEQRIERTRAESQASGGSHQLDLAIDRLQRTFVEQALELAPDEGTRELIIEGMPHHLGLESQRPYLIAPEEKWSSIVLTREPDAAEPLPAWWRYARFDTEALDLEEVPESPEEQLEPSEENLEQADQEEKGEDACWKVSTSGSAARCSMMPCHWRTSTWQTREVARKPTPLPAARR